MTLRYIKQFSHCDQASRSIDNCQDLTAAPKAETLAKLSEFGSCGMSLLKSEPPAPVRSLDELLAIAHTLEHEAAEHYAAFAVRAQQEELPELATLFERLAAEERHHEHFVEAWSQRQLGNVPDAAAIRWDLPETFDLANGTELASSRMATAYRILAMAVQNEDRAFALWSYIAAHAEADAIRDAAESMARQELQHAWELRRARRQAYHAEGLGKTRHAHAKDLASLGRTEFRLAQSLEQAAIGAEDAAAQELQRLARESRRSAAELSVADAAGPQTSGDSDILTVAEQLAEDFLDISDHSADEAEIAQAQIMAERAVLRLAQLRALGGALPRRNSAA